MSTDVNGFIDQVRKSKTQETHLNSQPTERPANERSLSDHLLHAGNRSSSDSPRQSTSPTKDPVLAEQAVRAWLEEQQDDKSAKEGIVRAVNMPELKSTSTSTHSSHTDSPKTPDASSDVGSGPSQQASDLPNALRGTGAFAEDAHMAPTRKKRKKP
ncbi:hypothetical protein CSOJ01_03734 [Colletotrichum sojae]|uniref:Uncharacterized protein n=1 Tax=Colletotrichum sojae TaxID=2175907 RepID=A0A8H6JL19_9PEZI|nr:hypothetical protein CSOJ01_03734 [Colletotrichum sojae]